MSCHHDLTLLFISQVTPKSFYNKQYRSKRAEDLFQREKTLLPQSQDAVKVELKCREIEKLILDLRATSSKLSEKINYTQNNWLRVITSGVFVSIEHMINKRRECARRIEHHKEQLRQLRQQSRIDTKKSFIMPCPSDCTGFLSDDFRCGICSKMTCRECYQIITDDHKCNSDDVKTVQSILRDTKPCPKCGTRIFKISGCYQVFCTHCHAVFCWRTGEFDNGPVHNPHYYEWRHKNPNARREENDEKDEKDECVEGTPPWEAVIRQVIRERNYDGGSSGDLWWEKPYMLIYHLKQVTLRTEFVIPDLGSNLDLRVKLLLRDIDEDRFKQELRIRMKRNEKNTEIRQILEMLANTIADTFNHFVTYDDVDLMDELHELRHYVNDELLEVKKRYGVVVPYINDKWYIIREHDVGSDFREFEHFY
jgi:hypothetical protein